MPHRLTPGDYCLHAGEWYAVTPDGRIALLSNHTVTAHENGSITVSPSILVRGGWSPGEWHGWLVRGEWHETIGQIARRGGAAADNGHA
jgi:hypothetical protein